MWYQLKSYITFLWRSKNQHGVHSPFVFDLLTKGMYIKGRQKAKAALKLHRKHLLKQEGGIKVVDYGAGSRVFGSGQRSIKRMVKVAGMSAKNQMQMAKLTAYLQPKNMLELGTSLGLGTAAMHLGFPQGKITTVEGCPNTLKVAANGFKHFDWISIQSKNELFSDYLKKETSKFDLVYLDGGHTKDFTLATFEQLLPLLHNDSLLILDDIYWSAQMGQAWHEIKKHPEVTITIDSYDWGWVFIRKEQPKQHFVLRV